jgi:hypothetical protein
MYTARNSDDSRIEGYLIEAVPTYSDVTFEHPQVHEENNQPRHNCVFNRQSGR